MNLSNPELVEGLACAVGFTMEDGGEAKLAVFGDEPLVMYGIVTLIKDLAEQDEMSFHETLEKIRYYYDNCETELNPSNPNVAEQIRKNFTLILGRKEA